VVGVYCLDFIDINMPGMNGLELLRILKEKFPDLKVFMITAYDEKLPNRDSYGADDYITKPVNLIHKIK